MNIQQCIQTYGNPVLRQKAESVTNVNSSIRDLADQMLKIMQEANGVGLAAQQIGKHIQICTVNIPIAYDIVGPEGKRLNPHVTMPMILINPEITKKAGRQTGEESCLSIPGISAPVERAFEITISFLDEKGKEQHILTKGFLARVIQHELDHLNGMLFVDRISLIKKIALSGKLKHLKKNTEKNNS